MKLGQRASADWKADIVLVGSGPISNPRVSYVAHYASYCDTGLKLPLSMFLLAFLQVLGICYSQVSPSSMGRSRASRSSTSFWGWC